MALKIDRDTARQLGIPDVPPRPAPAPPGNDKARQALFLAACKAHGLPLPEVEYPFARHCHEPAYRGRLWRFDYCWPQADVFLEVQGGLWTGGRHVRGQALLREYEKLNAATALGWSPVFCTPEQLDSLAIMPTLKGVLLP